MAKNKKRKGRIIRLKPKFSPKDYIRKAARKLPIKEILMTDTVMSEGIGYIIVSREKKNGDILLGIFMVDIYALGVKDCFYKFCDADEYRDIVDSLIEDRNSLEDYSDNFIQNIVYGAVDYATSLGFTPHKDFSLVSYILDTKDSIEPEEFEFGLDGKPYYVSGPFDDVDKIIATLNEHVGKGNYDYLHHIEMDDEHDEHDEHDENDKYDEYEEHEEEFSDEFGSPEKLAEHIDKAASKLDENEKNTLAIYSGYSFIVMDVVDNDVDLLKRKFLDSSEELIIKIHQEYLKSDFVDIIDDEMDTTLQKEYIGFISAIIEKIVIYKGVGYIADPLYIKSFGELSKEEPDAIMSMAYSFNFGFWGVEKLIRLFDFLAILGKPLGDFNYKNGYEFYQYLLKNTESDFWDYEEVEYVVDEINHHEETFGIDQDFKDNYDKLKKKYLS